MKALDCFKSLVVVLVLAFLAYGQQSKRIAITNIVDDGKPPLSTMELSHLTDRLHVIATEVLSQKDYIAVLDSGKNADYISRGRIGRFGNDFTIKIELQDSKSGTLVGVFSDNSKDIYGLLSTLNDKAPAMFKKLPIESSPVASVAPVTPTASVATPALAAAIVPAVKSIATSYTGSNKCHNEIFELSKTKQNFNMQTFVKDLGVSVAKVQASCKTKFTCPADDKITDVGLTAGCVKQLPAKPDGMIALLKDIGLDVGVSAATDLTKDLVVQTSAPIDKETDEDGMSPTQATAIVFGFIGIFTIFIVAAIALF